MKRYRLLRWDFDSRANIFRTEVKEDWEAKVKETRFENKRAMRESILYEFGVKDGDQKIQNIIDLRAAPFSFVAFHNKFLRQVRAAFVCGAYYPALTAVGALGERILNHLIFVLRGDFRSTEQYKKVHGKDSFDDWDLVIDILTEWRVLLPDAATAFGRLKDCRHAAVHFRPETDTNDRTLALDAIEQLQRVVQVQFSAFGAPWYIRSIRGASYVRRDAESEPFVKRIVLPNCVLVGPKNKLEHSSTSGWKVIDTDDYEDRDISDEEFAQLVDPR